MKLSVTIILLVGLINPLFAAVSSNPFLRPGSKQKIPPPPKAAKPLPVKQSDAEKQVEFRGYYILKGVPFFVFLTKKLAMRNGWESPNQALILIWFSSLMRKVRN